MSGEFLARIKVIVMLLYRIKCLERYLEGLRIMKFDNTDLCELGSETGNSKGLSVDRKSSKKCFSCGEVGHFKANCPTKVSEKVSQSNTVNAQCDYCGRMGHTMLKCWKYKADNRMLSLLVCFLV